MLPSDTFFYVRTLPAAAHRLGLPVVVVQKETTISQATMETFSKEVAAAAPFISDFMTVCSERQREFWIRAGCGSGTDRDHRAATFRRVRVEGAHGPPSSRKRVLFLTYALDAYVPGAGRGDGSSTWESLRSETEAELLDQVRTESCDVIVKCHPQQDHAAEARRLAAIAGAAWKHGFSMAAQDADTRKLIMATDVVVGFQTTALYEAVAAGRTVIYAAWGDAYKRYRDGLIPFDRAPADCVRHARSAQMLATLLTEQTAPRSSGCETWYEWALGVVDGRSTERVVERLDCRRIGVERDRDAPRTRRPSARVLGRSTGAFARKRSGLDRGNSRCRRSRSATTGCDSTSTRR